MLSKELSHNLDIQSYILNYIDHIKSRKEKELILITIFSDHTIIKYMPYQYDWVILPEFEVVTKALFKMSSMTIMLKRLYLTEKNSIFIREYMIQQFKLLKEGLIAFGCKKPPYKLEVSYTEHTIIELAEQILKLKYKLVESNDDLFRMDSI
jgi:hypothetical protein